MVRRITWLGHATVLIEAAGARLLTDPVLRGRIAHLRRHAPVPTPPEPVDGVLISHVHHDHLDVPSLPSILRGDTSIVGPHGTAALIRGAATGPMRELRAGEIAAVAGAEVEAVQAFHPTRRWPHRTDFDALGYLVEGVWFAGDTDLDPAMEALRGRVDVALLPIWGWGPSIGPGHLDPGSAARAAALVAPAIVIPIHYGTFLPIGMRWRHGAALSAPAHAFAAQVARVAPSVRVATLAPGESLTV